MHARSSLRLAIGFVFASLAGCAEGPTEHANGGECSIASRHRSSFEAAARRGYAVAAQLAQLPVGDQPVDHETMLVVPKQLWSAANQPMPADRQARATLHVELTGEVETLEPDPALGSGCATTVLVALEAELDVPALHATFRGTGHEELAFGDAGVSVSPGFVLAFDELGACAVEPTSLSPIGRFACGLQRADAETDLYGNDACLDPGSLQASQTEPRTGLDVLELMSRAFRAAALQLRCSNGAGAFELPLRFGARNQPCPPRDLTATVLASTADGELSVPFPVAVMNAASSECVERQLCGNQLCSAPGSDPTTRCSDFDLTGRTPRWSLSMHVAVHDGAAIEVSADALSTQSNTSCAGVAKIELR